MAEVEVAIRVTGSPLFNHWEVSRLDILDDGGLVGKEGCQSILCTVEVLQIACVKHVVPEPV